mmetsp:Transcript_12423/g.26836  ORF Transcript_12423/g.26836 Transcript_12423/m.26836 type:complete len:225 (-) Transcript_12423:548-1222(-)
MPISVAAACRRSCMSGMRSRSLMTIRTRTLILWPSSRREPSTRARAYAIPASTARTLALPSVSMTLCSAPSACSITASMGATFMSATSASTPPASRMMRLLCWSAARFIIRATDFSVLGLVRSARWMSLIRGTTPPCRQICCLPSGARAKVDIADMDAPARGVAGPSLMMVISSARMGDWMISMGYTFAVFLMRSQAPIASIDVFTFSKPTISCIWLGSSLSTF